MKSMSTEFLKGSCKRKDGSLCKHCCVTDGTEEIAWTGPVTERIPRPIPDQSALLERSYIFRTTVVHNCHGKRINLTGKRITSRQKEKPHGKKKKTHGKKKNLTAKRKRLTAKRKTSWQKEKPHGKKKNVMAKRKTSRQKEKGSR